MKKHVVVMMFLSFLFVTANVAAESRVCFARGDDALVAEWAAKDIYNGETDVGYNSEDPLYVATDKTHWGLQGTKTRSIVLKDSDVDGYLLAEGMAKTYFAIIQFPHSVDTNKNFGVSELGWSQVYKLEGEAGVKRKGNGNVEYYCE